MSNIIHKKGRTKDILNKHNQSLPLIDYLIPYIENKKEVRILDVGSGPFSIIGSYLPGINIEIIHCDKQDFSYFWNTQEVKQFVPIEIQNMESLTYKNNSFDIICCINALDHTRNAKQAVQEMIRVCKKDGWIYINCSLDQYSSSGGHHYWDAKMDGTFKNPKEIFNLKDFGFNIEFINNGEEARFNKIIATLQVK